MYELTDDVEALRQISTVLSAVVCSESTITVVCSLTVNGAG